MIKPCKLQDVYISVKHIVEQDANEKLIYSPIRSDWQCWEELIVIAIIIACLLQRIHIGANRVLSNRNNCVTKLIR